MTVLKWTCLGVFLGSMIGFFTYQSVTPKFESEAVVELFGHGKDRPSNHDSNTVLDNFFLSTELIGKALNDVNLLSRDAGLANTKNDTEAIRAWIRSPDYRVSEATDRDGATVYQIRYVSPLPSQSKRVITAILLAAESLVPSPTSPEQQVDLVETLISLTKESENRIKLLRQKLLNIPSHQEARWSESGVVSANTLEWSRLQREAEKLHQRKDALDLKLISLLALQKQSDEPMQINAANTEQDLAEKSNRPDANPEKQRLDTLQQISYLKAELRLIFQEHVRISGLLRVLARKIDLEEQLAFEEYSLRKQLEQELIIRDRVLAELKVPLSTPTYPNVHLRIISAASEPVQVAPVLFKHLAFGAVLGGLSLAVLSLIVIMGTLGDARAETIGTS